MRRCGTCNYWIMVENEAKEHSPTCPEPLQETLAAQAAQIAALEAKVEQLQADLAPFLALAKASNKLEMSSRLNSKSGQDEQQTAWDEFQKILAHPAVQRSVKEPG